MSPTTQGYTSFAVPVNSKRGIVQHGLRLHTLGILRFISACLLLIVFSAISYAQIFDENGYNWTSDWSNGVIHTESVTLNGYVIGDSAWNGWWVDGSLTNAYYAGISDLDVLSVRGNFVNHGIIANISTIALGSSSSFINHEDGWIWLDNPNNVIRVTGGSATIEGGTLIVDRSAYNFQVGKQYLFLETDKPSDGSSTLGKLKVYQDLTVAGSGDPGSVLDLVAVHGNWDGSRYVGASPWANMGSHYYWLEVQRAYLYGLEHENSPFKLTRNQRQIGQYLDTIGQTVKQYLPSGGSTTTPLWNLFQRLDGISDDRTSPYFNINYEYHQGHAEHNGFNPAARRALDELSGQIYSTVGIAQARNIEMVNATLADTLRSDVFKFSYIGNPNNAIRGQAIAPLRYSRWGTFLGAGGSSKGDNNTSGYRHSFGGIMAGFDRAFWTGARVGVYLTGITGDVKLKRLDERSETTGVSVGMYLRQELYYGYGLLAVGFGGDSYRTKRNLGMLGYRAESKFNGTVGSLYAERGIDIPIYYATIQPYVSAQAISVNQRKFRERMWDEIGQYTDVGLQGIKGDTCNFTTAAGLRLASTPLPMAWGQLASTARMSALYDISGRQEFVGQFYNPGGVNHGAPTGTTFKVNGNKPQYGWLNLGLGLNLDRNSTRMFLSGDVYANNKQALFTGNGGFITSW